MHVSMYVATHVAPMPLMYVLHPLQKGQRLRGGGKEDDDDHPKWDGDKGPSFEKFRREVRVHSTKIYASPNDDYHIWKVFIGQDQGGDQVGAPAMPIGPGAQAAIRLRNKRQAVGWSLACKMVDEASVVSCTSPFAPQT